MQLTRAQSQRIAIGIVVVFTALVVFFSSRESTRYTYQEKSADEHPAALPINTASSAFVLNRFQRSEIRDGRKVWEANAARGQYYPESSSAGLEDAELWFYRKEGEVIKLNALKATLHLDGASLSSADLSDGVKLNYNNKMNLETASATYDREHDTVTAPGSVHITSEMLDISGDVLEAKIEAQQIELKRNVRTVLRGRLGPGKLWDK